MRCQSSKYSSVTKKDIKESQKKKKRFQEKKDNIKGKKKKKDNFKRKKKKRLKRKKRCLEQHLLRPGLGFKFNLQIKAIRLIIITL